MRRLALSLTAILATLIVVACGDQQASPTAPVTAPEVSFTLPPGCNPLLAASLTVQLYSKYPLKSAQANLLLKQFLDAVATKPRPTVQKALLAFTRFTLESYYAGFLTAPRNRTIEEGISVLINTLYACAGLTPPGDLTGALSTGGTAQVIGPAGGTLKAVDENGIEQAALFVRPGSVDEDHLFTITPLPALTGQDCVSTLNTLWTTYGLCVQFEVFPEVAVFDPTIYLAICDRAPDDPLSDIVGDNLHSEVALVRDPHEGEGTETQVFQPSPFPEGFSMVCSREDFGYGIEKGLQRYLGARPAALLASAVNAIAGVVTPKPAYAFDGLGSEIGRFLSKWTIAHVQSRLSGTVTSTSGDPIAGAVVTFDKSNRGEEEAPSTTTGADGSFLSPLLLTGYYSVQVDAPGFQAVTRDAQHLFLTVDGNQRPTPRALDAFVLAPVERRIASVQVSPSPITIGIGYAVDMTYSVFDQFGVPFDVTTEVPPAIWEPSNGKLASAISNGLGRGIVVARGPGSVEVQATVGGVTGTADVTIEPVISFEYYPAGNATCTDSCPVSREFEVRGVSFSFTHEAGQNSSADLLQGGVYQAVADANHVVTKVAIGTFRITFSVPNTGVVFDVIGNAGVGPFDNFVAYDEAGTVISSEFINRTDISTYVASGGSTFRRERLTFLTPVARIEYDFDPFLLLFDDFSISTAEP